MEKYYRISESELRGLLEDSLTLSMLESDGVDNWEWYGESYGDIVRDYFPNIDEEEFYNLDFDDCVNLIIKDYEEAK